MIRSLEKALNQFGLNNNTFVLTSELKSKVGNIVIPKTKLKNILTQDDVYLHNGSEVISYKQLSSEIGISLVDTEELFQKEYFDIFQVWNNWNKKEKKGNNQKTLEILDLITNEKGWKASRSTWYSEAPDNIIENIDKYGFLEIKSLENPYYRNLNLVEENKLLVVDQNIRKDKFQLLKLLNLYDLCIDDLALDLQVTQEVALERLENYLSNHSLDLVGRFSVSGYDENLPKVTIRVGVIIPATLNNSKDSLVINLFGVPLDEFNRLTSMVIARKKLLSDFTKNKIQLTDLKSLKKEKVLWFNDNSRLYMYNMLDTEIRLIEDTIKCNLSCHRKNVSINWSLLKNIFDSVQLFYTQFENENISVPSGPDTSKFTATKSGWIRFDKDFTMGESFYVRGTHFKYGLKVGGNFNYGNPGAVMIYLLKYIEKFYGLPNEISIRSACGTNFSAVGVG